MIYKNLSFEKPSNRPFFYSSFVATADGKVWVGKPGYWPIGSKTDFETFTYLRAHADAIIDGKGTAMQFGKNTIETVHSDSFKAIRKSLGKVGEIRYFVVTKHPDEALEKRLANPFNFSPEIFQGDINELVQQLKNEQLDYVFVDGGPHLLTSFLDHNLLDELFITIAPRIFGNDGSAMTMVEGLLLDPKKVQMQLLSVEKAGNEVFLRYRLG
ncbi:MAG: RibD family protein [Candidatus Levybacteria bacterium]|nr:RibD family protein [Candidatus Levybacteria bacterium]